MGKASEIGDDLLAHPLTPEEVAERKGPRPSLRLRSEVLAQALDPNTRVRDVLGRLGGEAVSSVALHDPDSGATAVAVPLDRYLQLIGAELAASQQMHAHPDGRMAPSEAAFATSGVEQVNPYDTWVPVPGYDPTKPAPE